MIAMAYAVPTGVIAGWTGVLDMILTPAKVSQVGQIRHTIICTATHKSLQHQRTASYGSTVPLSFLHRDSKVSRFCTCVKAPPVGKEHVTERVKPSRQTTKVSARTLYKDTSHTDSSTSCAAVKASLLFSSFSRGKKQKRDGKLHNLSNLIRFHILNCHIADAFPDT